METRVIVYPAGGGRWIAECQAVPGCVVEGETREEAVGDVERAIGERLGHSSYTLEIVELLSAPRRDEYTSSDPIRSFPAKLTRVMISPRRFYSSLDAREGYIPALAFAAICALIPAIVQVVAGEVTLGQRLSLGIAAFGVVRHIAYVPLLAGVVYLVGSAVGGASGSGYREGFQVVGYSAAAEFCLWALLFPAQWAPLPAMDLDENPALGSALFSLGLLYRALLIGLGTRALQKSPVRSATMVAIVAALLMVPLGVLLNLIFFRLLIPSLMSI